MMKGRRLELVYVMFAEILYVDNTRENEIIDLWHMQLSHVNYSKIDVIMEKSILKRFPQLEVRINTICT